jgi:arylsulfatase A-like enzyme/predicted negative regulator of RcsB-dependent stress response
MFFRRALGLWSVSLSLACGGSRPAPSRPPIVLISIDTLRADRLPAYGYAGVETPHIDALRADATLFRNAYTHVPLTLPAHVSLFTGVLPPDHGVRDNLGYHLDSARHATVAQILKAQGYATGAAVSAYVLRAATGVGAGFDFYDDAFDEPIGLNAASAVQRAGGATLDRLLPWLDSVQSRSFLLFLHIYEPHAPLDPPEPFKSRYADRYDGEVAAADAIVGRLLEALRARSLYDRAAVILLSDHGEGLNDHGEEQHGILLYREVLHVPLLLKQPGNAGRGAVVDRPVALVDVLPTIAALARAEPPPTLAGHSLLEDRSGPRAIYSETYYPRLHLGWSELRSMVDEHWHFIAGPRAELYDVVADPRERNDVSAAQGDARHALRNALYAVPIGPLAPSSIGAAEREKLAALGYLGGGAADDAAPRPHPVDRIAVIKDMEAAFRLAAEGHREAAVTALRRIVDREPGLMDAHFELGRILSALGRHEESYQAYRQAVRTSPASAVVLAAPMARACLETGRIDEADTHARLALEYSPGAAHEILARIALHRNDLATAEAHLQQIAGDTQAESNRFLLEAEMAIRRGQLERALETLSAGERFAASKHREPMRDLSFLRGDALARLGRHAEAAAAFEQEIHDHPENVQAYARLAIVYGLLHRTYGEVDRLLERMYAAVPSSATAQLAAETLESMGDARAAGAWRRRGAHRRPAGGV